MANAEQLDIRLKNLTETTEQYNDVQGYLSDAADRLNIRYSLFADNYTRMIVLERQNIVTMTESRAIVEGMINAQKTLGASNEKVNQSMFGMTQAITQGTVQTTELLQVTEPLPGLLQAMDEASGLAAGGFKRLVGEGKVTSQYFKEVLIKALDEYSGAAESMADTITGQAMIS